jgi:DUF4097 and DUF4098 domain-containing protein YvlB
MKRTILALDLVILLVGITMLSSCRQGSLSINGYNFDRQGETASRHHEGKISAEIRSLKVDNQFGDVRISVADDSPRWTWDLTCWAKTQEIAQGFTEQIQLRVDEQGDASVWTLLLPEPPTPELRGVESNLTVAVPAAVRVEVANRFGNTDVRDVKGGTHARCQHGKLELTGLAGKIDAETSFAELRAEGISGGRLVNQHGSIRAVDVSGNLEAKTQFSGVEIRGVSGKLNVDNAHGAVTAQKVTGPVKITSSFADIGVEDVGGEVILHNEHGAISGRQLRGNARVETAFAAIDLEVACPELVCKNQHGAITLNLIRSGSLRLVDAETSFGNLHVNVADSPEPKIQAHTSFGKVSSDFPVFTMETGADNFRDLDPRKPRITLKNEHGDIRVRNSLTE